MGLRITAGPEAEPITLDEAKVHARILTDADDAHVAMLVRAARRHAEARCNRSFAVQEYELILDAFPVWGPIELPRPPLVEVESITYAVDYGNGEETVDPSIFRVVPGTPGLVVLKPGASWPTTRTEVGIVVRYSAGFPAEELPDDARLAMLMLVAHWYDRREPIATGTIVAALPFAVEALLSHVDWRTRG